MEQSLKTKSREAYSRLLVPVCCTPVLFTGLWAPAHGCFNHRQATFLTETFKALVTAGEEFTWQRAQ